MEKKLKIHDFFDRNLQSIFSHHEKKIFFWKFYPKGPLGGPKIAKKRKKTRLLTFLIFYLANEKGHPSGFFHFQLYVG